MSCDLGFSFNNLTGRSVEWEYYRSQLCLPNIFKMVIYLLYLVIFASFTVYSVYLYYHFKQRNNRIVYSLMIIASLSLTILQVLFLLGNQTPFRIPLLYVGYQGSFCVTVAFQDHLWYKFINNSMMMLNSNNGSFGSFRIIYWVTFIIINVCNAVFIVGFSVVAVVYYDQPEILNLTHMLYLTTTIVVGCIMSIVTAYISHAAISICQPSMDDAFVIMDSRIIDFVRRTKGAIRTFKFTIAFQVCIIPISILWYILSANHNINGVSFYYYFFLYPLMCVALASQLYTITYDHKKYSSTVSGNSSSGINNKLTSG